MRLYYFFIILIFSSITYSSPYEYVSLARSQITSSGIIASMTAEAIISSKPSYISRAVSIGKASVGAAIKSRMFSPWGLALLAVYAASEFVIDEDNETITNVVPESAELGGCGGGTVTPKISLSDCITQQEIPFGDGNVVYDGWYPTGGYYRLEHINSPATTTGTWFPENGYINENPLGSETPVADIAIADYFLDQATQNEVKDLLIDPVTGLPDTNITEIDNSITDINEDYLYDTDNNVNTDIDYDVENGDTGLDTETELEAKEAEPCVINPQLIECLEVGTELADLSVPVDSFNYSYSPFSLSSSGSCPAPLNATLLNGYNVSISYDFLCTFASTIRLIILAIATLAGLRLMSGAVRQ